MPCCVFGTSVPDYPKNCQCGHHLASYGLIKKMVKASVPRQRIQLETKRWISYFFPKEAIAKELEISGASQSEIADIFNDFCLFYFQQVEYPVAGHRDENLLASRHSNKLSAGYFCGLPQSSLLGSLWFWYRLVLG